MAVARSTIDGSEFLLYSLLNAMIMCKSRLIDMFKVWDEDSSGGVSEKEFTMAVDGMGFNAPDSVIKKLFAKFDPDKSGTLKYDELTEMLDKTVGDDMTKINLLNAPEQPNRDGKGSRLEPLTAKNVNKNYVVARVHALSNVDLVEDSDMSIAEQLGCALVAQARTIRDLFHEWDVDGNGGVSKKEFRKAIKMLGFNAPKADVDQLFQSLNDGGEPDFLLYDEIDKKIRKFMHPATLPKPSPPSAPKPEKSSPRK